MPNSDPIQHVVVLMLENRSFDHMLGTLADELHFDGVPSAAAPHVNVDDDGTSYRQTGGASRSIRYDPHHELRHVKTQMASGNSGFVQDFSRSYPDSLPANRAEVMKFHNDLPALHTLARNFVVCDHWFASVPGPTWTNRFFVHSGTSLGRVEMPNGILDANLHWYDQITLYDRLNEKEKNWFIYYGDIPQSLMLVNQLEPHNACRYKKMIHFYRDAAGPAKDFPDYCFIEPSYYQPGANDDHPTHDVAEGDRLIASVYNAVRANEDLWASTLLIVLFDEHGGFYDHVTPPAAVPPDHHVEEYSFDQLGLRVPAILVSPYVKKAGVVPTIFDHTSILRYLTDKWSLGLLGLRTKEAATFAPAIGTAKRADTPVTLPLSGPNPLPIAPLVQRPSLSAHQSALFAMTQLLESMTSVEASALLGRTKRMITGFDGAVDVAMERVADFLGAQQA